MFKYLKYRYPEVFGKQGLKTPIRKTKDTFEISEILKNVDSIAKINRQITGGDLQSLKLLENFSVDEYYSTLNLFLLENQSEGKKAEENLSEIKSSRNGS